MGQFIFDLSNSLKKILSILLGIKGKLSMFIYLFSVKHFFFLQFIYSKLFGFYT